MRFYKAGKLAHKAHKARKLAQAKLGKGYDVVSTAHTVKKKVTDRSQKTTPKIPSNYFNKRRKRRY